MKILKTIVINGFYSKLGSIAHTIQYKKNTFTLWTSVIIVLKELGEAPNDKLIMCGEFHGNNYYKSVICDGKEFIYEYCIKMN